MNPALTPDDPLLPALRRAIAGIGLAMMNDGLEDAAQALFMAWPFLDPQNVDTWERMLDPSALGEHPALVDLADIALGVVQYDVPHVLTACDRAQRWKDAAIERMGGTPTDGSERRRQQHDATPVASFTLNIAEHLSPETHLAWYLRIGSRLMNAVRQIAVACDDTDMASDVGFQLSQMYQTPKWWTEGTHVVVLSAEARLSDPAATDLLAEICAIIVLLHLGLPEDDDLRYGHIVSAHERMMQVLSAVHRWLDTPDAPLDFSVDPTHMTQSLHDTQELTERPGDGIQTATQIAVESDAWAKQLVEVGEAKPFDAAALLSVVEQGVQRTLTLPTEPPEAVGAHLQQRAMVDRALPMVSKLLRLDEADVEQACKDGTASGLEVDPRRIEELSGSGGFTPQALIGAALILLLVIAVSAAFMLL